MGKYFNTLDSPVLYNDQGQTADGYSWFETEETPQIKALRIRGDLLEVDSAGNFIYDIRDDSENQEPVENSGPLSPENASKQKTRKNLEG